MDPTGVKGQNSDIFDEIWARPGKVHTNHVTALATQITVDTPLETIWTMVELSDIPECDRIVMFWALSDIRQQMCRIYVILLASLS